MSIEFNPKNLHLRSTKVGASIFDGKVQIAFIGADIQHRKEIANLLAAAPDLLNTIAGLLPYLEQYRDEIRRNQLDEPGYCKACSDEAGCYTHALLQELDAALYNAESALAKARGESE